MEVWTGPIIKITLAVTTVGVAVRTGGFFRWLAVFVSLTAPAFVLFVYVSKRLAAGIISRRAPPTWLTRGSILTRRLPRQISRLGRWVS
ncbi:MAG: hypothetical protein GY926_03270 [bacterium]|nr:hypothetical protein [bacterium]